MKNKTKYENLRMNKNIKMNICESSRQQQQQQQKEQTANKLLPTKLNSMYHNNNDTHILSSSSIQKQHIHTTNTHYTQHDKENKT